MKWITREKIKVDRVACPWLIRKFIDADAEFIFLPRDTNWAAIKEGIVYDVSDCEPFHQAWVASFKSRQVTFTALRFSRTGRLQLGAPTISVRALCHLA